MRNNIHQMARCVCCAAALAALTACGGGDSGAVAPVTLVTPAMSATYTVGGTVTGLAGPGLVLENSLSNGQFDDLAVSRSGAFTFDVPLGRGLEYGVGVKTQPLTPPQYCQVGEPSGSGIIGAADVTNVQVICDAGYTVGGTVSGLLGFGLVLQIAVPDESGGPGDLAYGNALPVNSDGAFTLDAVYPSMFSGPDFVLVGQQPSSPTQNCVVENSRIGIQNANDTSVAVACSEFSYVANAADNTLSAYRVNATTGALLAVGTPIATGKSPQAVVGTTSRLFVYVGNQGSNDVSAFAVNVASGTLTAVPGSPFAAGTGPQALALYQDSYLYVANRGSNTLSAFAVNATSGALTPLSPATYATGQGPSALAVSPYASELIVANNGGSNDISAFVIDRGTGGLTPVVGSPFAAGANPLSLAFGASGKFLYTANPGGTSPSISGFSVASSGALTPLSGSPFSAAVNRSITFRQGVYLYATTGAGVLGYSIDAATGLLTTLPGFPVVSGLDCYSLTIDPTSQFLYVANNASANVSGFGFDDSGGLTPIAGSPFAAGNSPDSLTTP
jgi:6-phosphogluconolactonase (cycloisomerase 2 family)